MGCKNRTRMKVRAQIRLQSQTLLPFGASALAPTFTSNKARHAAYNLNPFGKEGQGHGLRNIESTVLVDQMGNQVNLTHYK
ncbi:hypothetical protein VIGAN_03019200 [Vigna angularis var. angularis]|uniref:Uncharacterized protein n=1 Tax=Vigna angularis var. angularis TaxID=157739 RepID=A0A0S3RIY8_PHAAN|nr:hypothetical protein VIGAN_03019200 [Vigna angularis var. angularis]